MGLIKRSAFEVSQPKFLKPVELAKHISLPIVGLGFVIYSGVNLFVRLMAVRIRYTIIKLNVLATRIFWKAIVQMWQKIVFGNYHITMNELNLNRRFISVLPGVEFNFHF